MDGFPKPRIVVSSCLGFASCRFNGATVHSDFVEKLKAYAEFIPVCPELGMGLGTPRDPLRIVTVNGKRRLYQPASGKDFTKEMQGFSEGFLDSLEGPDGFILKHRSPSCGIKDVRIYHSKDPGSGSGKGKGLFGSEVLDRYGHLPVEDEARLRNLSIREDFLNKAFTYARFREVKKSGRVQDLIAFHTRNKFLLMAYSQSRMHEMGRVVAEAEGMEAIKEYERHLRILLGRFPRRSALINVIMHAYGHFSGKLSTEERKLFLDAVDEYRDRRLPLSALNYMLRSWSAHFKESYLSDQTFFHPFPHELVDSGDVRFTKQY